MEVKKSILLFCLSLVSFVKAVDLSKVPAGCAGIAKCELEKVTKLDEKENYNPILWSAATKCEACDLCNALHKGADINSTDSLGNSALYSAVEANCLEAAKILLQNGANVTQNIVELAQRQNNTVFSGLLSQHSGINITASAVVAPKTEVEDRTEIERPEKTTVVPVSQASPAAPTVGPVPPVVRGLAPTGVVDEEYTRIFEPDIVPVAPGVPVGGGFVKPITRLEARRTALEADIKTDPFLEEREDEEAIEDISKQAPLIGLAPARRPI